MSGNPVGPQFSILIAVYNAANTIDRCIGSIVAARKAHAVEVIVVDDGSTDNTPERCADYAQRFPWIRLLMQPHAGVAEVRNGLLREATGTYLAFVDADDSIEPWYFDFLDEKLRETGADMVVFGHNLVTPDGKSWPKPNVCARLEGDDLMRMQLRVAENASIYMLCWARMFASGLADGFSFDPRIRLGEDTAFNIHVMNRARLVHVVQDRPYNYFDLPGSLSSDAYKPALLESFEAHYHARLEAHVWPEPDAAGYAVLEEDIAKTYIEHVLFYLIGNARYLPLRIQVEELKRIRHSIIYLRNIPKYEGHAPARGKRFLISHFIEQRYLWLVAGSWLSYWMRWLRTAIAVR